MPPQDTDHLTLNTTRDLKQVLYAINTVPDKNGIHGILRVTPTKRTLRCAGDTVGPYRHGQRSTWDLEAVRVAELVDQPLRPLSLLHDTLLVVLAYRATELVVVHGRPVLALAPEFCHPHRVLDLEDALLAVDPADGRCRTAAAG